MALYERLIGLHEPKIPVHTFFAAMQEYMLDFMTGAQAVAAFGLDATEQAQALALRSRILQEPTTTNGIQRRLKALELENVLILAEGGVEPYTTVAAVTTRLGV